MAEHEAVPPEIAKTLVGWKKHFNAYTTQARFNTVMLSVGLAVFGTIYAMSGGKKEAKK